MASPKTIRMDELDQWFTPAPNGSQGRIVHRNEAGNILRPLRTAARPDTLTRRGRKRIDNEAVPVVELIQNPNGGRGVRLAITDEERIQRRRLLDRAAYARKIAAEGDAEREARRAKIRVKNQRRAEKINAIRAQTASPSLVARLSLRMHLAYNDAVDFARANPGTCDASLYRYPLAYDFNAMMAREQDRIARRVEQVERSALRAAERRRQRQGIVCNWVGARLGYALSAKAQNFRPGTRPPKSRYTGDALTDWRPAMR